jgi:transposase
MSWRPTKLTRAQLEERRLEGARLLRQGKLSQAEIARHLGTSPAAVSQWKRTLDAKGRRALRRRHPAGRPRKLSAKQQRQLCRLLDRGAVAAGFESHRWTLARVRQLIEREFGVNYNPCSLSYLLRQAGWSVQQPQPQAAERDEELIRAWLTQDWPRIKKVAAARHRNHLLR